MEANIKNIAARDPVAIQQEIDALEKDISENPGKQKTTANIIRLEIAELRRDVQEIAEALTYAVDSMKVTRHLVMMLCDLRELEKGDDKP